MGGLVEVFAADIIPVMVEERSICMLEQAWYRPRSVGIQLLLGSSTEDNPVSQPT